MYWIGREKETKWDKSIWRKTKYYDGTDKLYYIPRFALNCPAEPVHLWGHADSNGKRMESYELTSEVDARGQGKY